MEHGTFIPAERTRTLTYSLLAATGICLLLLIVRAVLTGKILWTGFFGNLLLAWVPMIVALCLCSELDRPARRRWIMAGMFAVWVLFFPNAAYIVTDLIHLKSRPPVPRWFDYILITAYAWTGLFLCYISLRLLHARVQRVWGSRIGWTFATGMLAASSLGIYVGRFFRWNSWDVILRPWKPLSDLKRFVHPPVLLEAVAFCFTFFLLSVMVYTVLHSLAHLHSPVALRDQEQPQ
jgi:uncharacterized membrane protein